MLLSHLAHLLIPPRPPLFFSSSFYYYLSRVTSLPLFLLPSSLSRFEGSPLSFLSPPYNDSCSVSFSLSLSLSFLSYRGFLCVGFIYFYRNILLLYSNTRTHCDTHVLIYVYMGDFFFSLLFYLYTKHLLLLLPPPRHTFVQHANTRITPTSLGNHL